MRILIVTSSLDDGGVARIVSDLTILLPSEWEFDILLNHSEDIRYPYKGNIISLNMAEPKSRVGLVYQFNVFCRRVSILRKLKKSGSYDVCISFMDSGNVANILSGNKHCKNIISIENHMSLSAEYSLKYRLIVNPLIKLFYNKADGIVVCSEDSKNDLIKNYGIKKDRLCRIYCSVDLKEIERTISKETIDENDKGWFSRTKTVITAGRYTLQKGQWHLIRAFNRVRESIPDAKLVIFGAGEMAGRFEAIISEYGLDDSVKLHGYSNKLAKYISESAVFAMPSLYEGFPTALLMALACGTACVSSDFTSGAREQLIPDNFESITGYKEGEYGVVSEELDRSCISSKEPLSDAETGLADVLILLLSNDELRDHYADKAKERSLDFDSEKICSEWREYIEKVSET